jgi:hypothetical protein
VFNGVVVYPREVKSSIVSDNLHSGILTRKLAEILKGLRIIAAIINDY